MRYTHLIYYVFGLCSGIFIAHSGKKETHVKSIISATSDESKKQTQAKTITHIDRIYSKCGKLKEEKIDTANVQNDLLSYSQKINLDQLETEVKLQEKNNWILGVSYPLFEITNPMNYSNVSVQVSRRIVGDFYLSAQSDLKFKQFQVGVQYNF